MLHFFTGQVGNVITNRNASRLEFERLLVRMIYNKNLNSCFCMHIKHAKLTWCITFSKIISLLTLKK